MVQKKGRYFYAFIALLVTVVVLSCVLVGTVLAWLERDYTRNSSNLNLGKIELALYADGTKVTGTTTGGVWTCDTPYTVRTSTTTTRTLNLKMENTGNINAIVRANIRMYMLDDDNNEVTLLLSGTPAELTPPGTTVPHKKIISVALDATGWVLDFPENNQVAAGYMYLQSQLTPINIYHNNASGSEIKDTSISTSQTPIIRSIVVPEAYKSEPIYVSVTLEAVAYAGNIYKKIYEDASLRAAHITTTTRPVDSREYWTFTAPTAVMPEIPIKAFPFGTTIPKEWSAWKP